PPDTFVLREGSFFTATDTATADDTRSGAVLTGTSACGGHATARATVLEGIADAHRLAGGDILVTRQTDPGWAPVFPLIAGLVMERGGGDRGRLARSGAGGGRRGDRRGPDRHVQDLG